MGLQAGPSREESGGEGCRRGVEAVVGGVSSAAETLVLHASSFCKGRQARDITPLSLSFHICKMGAS